MSADPRWDILERKNLLQQVAFMKEALNKDGREDERSKSCAIMVDELERWRQECTIYLDDTKGKWHHRIQNQRKELKRLARTINELLGVIARLKHTEFK